MNYQCWRAVTKEQLQQSKDNLIKIMYFRHFPLAFKRDLVTQTVAGLACRWRTKMRLYFRFVLGGWGGGRGVLFLMCAFMFGCVCVCVFVESFHKPLYNFNTLMIINSLISFVLALPSLLPPLASRKTFISPRLSLSTVGRWKKMNNNNKKTELLNKGGGGGRNAASPEFRWITGGWKLNAFNLQPSQWRIGRRETSPSRELEATSWCAEFALERLIPVWSVYLATDSLVLNVHIGPALFQQK